MKCKTLSGFTALIAAVVLVCAACAGPTNGGGGGGDRNGTPPTEITINLGGVVVPGITVNGHGGTVQYLDDTFPGITHSGYEFTKTSTHRGSYAWFELDLGSKELSDYESIMFEYSGTTSRTYIALIARDTAFPNETLETHPTGGPGQATFGSDNGYLANGQVSEAKNESGVISGTVTLNLIFAAENYNNFLLGSLSGIVYFSIYEHVAASSVSSITNIRFVEKN